MVRACTARCATTTLPDREPNKRPIDRRLESPWLPGTCYVSPEGRVETGCIEYRSIVREIADLRIMSRQVRQPVGAHVRLQRIAPEPRATGCRGR